MASRRDFLFAVSAGGLTSCQNAVSWADAHLPAEGIRMDQETKRLVRLIDRTPREKCQELLVNEFSGGVPYRELLAAVFMYAALRDGHHSVYLVHAAHQLSLDLSADDRMLPLFWAIEVAKEHYERSGRSPVSAAERTAAISKHCHRRFRGWHETYGSRKDRARHHWHF